MLVSELRNVNAKLRASRSELAASDKNLSERTGELKSARADLAASDKSLLEANDQLLRLVEELAHANEKLLHANEQLSNSERLQKEFINIAAHELKTPVQPILGVMDAYDISAKAEAEEEKEEEVLVKKIHMKMVARNALRLARLSSDILDATKIESHTLKLNIDKKIDLIDLVRDAVEDAKKQVKGGNIEFITNFPPQDVAVDADSYRIRQVLANLLDNAIKFTGKGRIAVTVNKSNSSSSGGQVEVIVSDSGKGIDSEVRSRLFQKFASKTDAGTGTGLGLYISKAIIEAHQGKIRAENNKEGKGSTFAFTLSPAMS